MPAWGEVFTRDLQALIPREYPPEVVDGLVRARILTDRVFTDTARQIDRWLQLRLHYPLRQLHDVRHSAESGKRGSSQFRRRNSIHRDTRARQI